MSKDTSKRVWDTVNSAYNGSSKKLSVIRNWFSFPDLYPSLFYVKNGYSGFGYKELSLRRNSYSGPNANKKLYKFRSVSGNPLLV